MPTPRPKRALLLADLTRFEYLEKVFIESIEQALYRLEVEVDGCLYFINEVPGKSLTRRSIVEIQSLLRPFVVHKMYLRHMSPYDEMIGHDVNPYGNEMLVPLGNFFDEMPELNKKSTKH